MNLLDYAERAARLEFPSPPCGYDRVSRVSKPPQWGENGIFCPPALIGDPPKLVFTPLGHRDVSVVSLRAFETPGGTKFYAAYREESNELLIVL